MNDDRETVLLRLVGRSTDDVSIVLDAMVHGPDDEIGDPMAFVFARPDTEWFDTFVLDLLGAWATQSEAVVLRVKPGRHGRAAVLQQRAGPTKLQLDLVGVA
jgi:hypothetical protein